MLAILHLPLKDNDGILLEAENKIILSKLAQTFGGYTALNGIGAWYDTESGKLFEDDILRVLVYLGDYPKNDSKYSELRTSFLNVAHEAKVTHRQYSVYVEFSEREVIFI